MPSVTPDGQTMLAFGQGAVHASHSVQAGKGKASTIRVISGPLGTGSSASVDLTSSLGSRLQTALASRGSTLFRLTWKEAVTPSGRRIYRLRASGRLRMTRPLLLDLFCGAGGASMGYHLAGFGVVGVDHRPQPNYPFEFIQADALEFLAGRMTLLRAGLSTVFAAIHASPPCQWQTAYKRRPGHVAPSPNLITPTRSSLLRLGLPYVIESPESGLSRQVMVQPIRLCGSSFGLDVRRHRLFETSLHITGVRCDHGQQAPRFTPASNRTNLRSTVEIGVWCIPLEVQQQAMGIDWMTREELSQAIPPAYTEHLSRQLIAHIEKRSAA